MASKHCLSLVKFPISFGERHCFVSLMRGVEFVTGTVTGRLSRNIRVEGHRCCIWGLLDVWHVLVCRDKLEGGSICVREWELLWDAHSVLGVIEQSVNGGLGYGLNLPDCCDDGDDSDGAGDSLASRLVSGTSAETPSTSEKPDVSSDDRDLIPCAEVEWIRDVGGRVAGSGVYCGVEGGAARLKSFGEMERCCGRHSVGYDPGLFDFGKDSAESRGFSDLSGRREALVVEVAIPNCYKQAIRSRDASK
ncbi:retrovirus-related Pol polyprotein from transposon RE1 [Trichonephila clavipes]|uniref:Retrovirus-related Pol polyprotein from transposon RE1 n=1 Tax=Trichonephila clavipes TaxID=2585209 RepID=A0A8X7BD62_TRICX|nr:retrovirus-related Pol polyprotein from transposon RE1 [Trichonephila clavipes]